ncbi:hypothetical protein LTR62_008254 [Meristemomyces frigidus]|uniref:DUF300-domain-containing protein n=1 Tax=Meristemomyces frigidus TaxID=1508187 RepID=A0AAN7YLZ3_9PEZI|nr:hypothetical protein LTR62_008254 [Meristemomyces frigidus]
MKQATTTCPVPTGSEDYGVRGSAWKPMLWAAAGCTVATTTIALSLITLHVRRYRAPREQRQIIRIAFSTVIYAIVAFFELYRYDVARYIDPLGDFYEALGLCALFLLFIQYAAPSGTYDDHDDLFEAIQAAEEIKSTFDWPRISWIFVFQYPIVELVSVVIELSTTAGNHYCLNSLQPQFAHLWVEILCSIGIGFCVISIFQFRTAMKQRMKVRRGLAKLVCFKLIVFIRFTQAWVFSMLLEYNVIKTSESFSYNDILWGIPGLATCAEMVLFSLGFWYAFSSTEYGSNAKPRDTTLPLWKAVLDALNPMDLITGIIRIFPLFGEVSRSGDWSKWVASKKDKGLIGLVWKGLGKNKGGKSSGSGLTKYQELNESMGSLKKPAGSHDQRSASAVTVDSETAYSPPDAVSGDGMYQPPAESPTTEANAHLMAGNRDGQPHSSSRGYWNGRRYDRTPSPSSRFSFVETGGRDML